MAFGERVDQRELRHVGRQRSHRVFVVEHGHDVACEKRFDGPRAHADEARRFHALLSDSLKKDKLEAGSKVDYATWASAELAREAALFLTDERGQFLANREAGLFEGYPDPALTLGEALRDGVERPASGRVLVSHLGVGLADVVFGRAILERATSLGLGLELKR